MLKLLMYVPILGWFVKSAVKGSYAERLALVLNVFLLYGVALYFIGYPLLIVTVLAATAIYLLGLVLLTSQGLGSNSVMD